MYRYCKPCKVFYSGKPWVYLLCLNIQTWSIQSLIYYDQSWCMIMTPLHFLLSEELSPNFQLFWHLQFRDCWHKSLVTRVCSTQNPMLFSDIHVLQYDSVHLLHLNLSGAHAKSDVWSTLKLGCDPVLCLFGILEFKKWFPDFWMSLHKPLTYKHRSWVFFINPSLVPIRKALRHSKVPKQNKLFAPFVIDS